MKVMDSAARDCRRLDDLCADDLRSIATFLPQADISSASRAFKALNSAFGDQLESHRITRIQRLQEEYSEGADSWHQLLSSSKHIALQSHRTLDESAARTFVTLLRQHRSIDSAEALSTLVVDHPLVTPAAVSVLARSLPVAAPMLSSLTMAGCQVDDVGARAIADVVASGKLRRLRTLELEDNPFSPPARGSLRQACRKHGVALSAYSEIENESLFE